MITSGLVLTLNADPALAQQAQTTLLDRVELTIGQQNDRWLPIVIQASDVAASRDLHDWLCSLPGIDFVDVVHVEFEDTDRINEVADEH